MVMAVCRVFDLRIAVIPVQIREHPTFSPFQIRSDALRNTPQLFRLPLFRSPSLLLFDPGVELKMWIFRFHSFDVLIPRFAFALSQGRVDTARLLEAGHRTPRLEGDLDGFISDPQATTSCRP
jgi:hypothetical protein